MSKQDKPKDKFPPFGRDAAWTLTLSTLYEVTKEWDTERLMFNYFIGPYYLVSLHMGG